MGNPNATVSTLKRRPQAYMSDTDRLSTGRSFINEQNNFRTFL